MGRLIRASVSGREQIERGFASDVDIAVELEVSGAPARRHHGLMVEGACYRIERRRNDVQR